MPYDHQRSAGQQLSVHKSSATIDVIGSSVRDTRRHQLEFRESEQQPDLYADVLLYFCHLLDILCGPVPVA